MLPRRHRLTHAADFSVAVRRGTKASSRHLVVHVWAAGSQASESPAPPRVGFVVSKAVGNAVIRNQVKRRLRHLMWDRRSGLPVGSLVVARALPSSAGVASSVLAAELDRSLARAGAYL